MVEYTCTTCGKTFNRKSNFEYHLNRKFKCAPRTEAVSDIEKHRVAPNGHKIAPICTVPDPPSPETPSPNTSAEHRCSRCGREFARKYTLQRHEGGRRCHGKDSVDELQREIRELKAQLATASTTGAVNNNTIVNNTTNTNNGTINNIVVVPFGREDVSKLTKKEMEDILQFAHTALERYVKLTHFNPRLPENHNIYVSNLRASSVKVFDETKSWRVKDIQDVIDDVIDNGSFSIQRILDEFDLNIQESKLRRMKDFMVRIAQQDDEEKRDKWKDKMRRMIMYEMYNNRKLVDEGRVCHRLAN